MTKTMTRGEWIGTTGSGAEVYEWIIDGNLLGVMIVAGYEVGDDDRMEQDAKDAARLSGMKLGEGELREGCHVIEGTPMKIKRGDVLTAWCRVGIGACDRVYVTRVTATTVYGVWEDDEETTAMPRSDWSFTPAKATPITFTVRPSGGTAWATGLPTLRKAREAARKALDAGLRLVAITRDEDGKQYAIWPE